MFDRKAHCQRIGAMGGRTTRERHPHHHRTIAPAGWKACVEKHDVGYCRGILTAKGWTPYPDAGQQLREDLALGVTLAELAR